MTGVLDGQGNVVGIAWLGGAIVSRKGPVQLWDLEINKDRLEGRWICQGRQFVRLGDAAEAVSRPGRAWYPRRPNPAARDRAGVPGRA